MKREKIEDALLRMGIPANIKGFAYITQAVLLIDSEDGENLSFGMIYSEIGRKFQGTRSQTERAIRHAFGIARDVRGDYDVVNHYIGFSNVSNSASLAQLYLMLKREEENEESNA